MATNQPPVDDLKALRRIPELDGIRGLAISLVVIYHCFFITLRIRPGSFLWHAIAPLRYGWSGVDLFFVLSGFLIGGILMDARSSPNYFTTFYVRRFFRIVPIYFVLLGICFFLTIFVKSTQTNNLHWIVNGRLPWAPYLFFGQNIWMAAQNKFGSMDVGVTWSLAVEEQFYLTLPLVVWLLKPGFLTRALVGAVCLVPLLRVFLFWFLPESSVARYVLMPCRADALLLGVLVAEIMRDARYRGWAERNSRFLGAIVLVLLGGCGAMISQAYWSTKIAQTVGYTWIALLYATFLLYLLTHDSALLRKIFRSKPLTFLGTIAYGVYLFHQPILLCVASLSSPTLSLRNGFPEVYSFRSFATTSAALILTLFLAQISWKRFEKPLVDLGHRSKY